jgi:hypothetical protein
LKNKQILKDVVEVKYGSSDSNAYFSCLIRQDSLSVSNRNDDVCFLNSLYAKKLGISPDEIVKKKNSLNKSNDDDEFKENYLNIS